MSEEKNNKKEKEECPLCKVSEDTIEKLKKEKEKEKESLREPESLTKKKSSRKFKVWFLIFIFATSGLVFYQFSPNFFSPRSEGEKDLPPGQSEEKVRSIWDIFAKSLKVDDLAPDFISEDIYGNEISLSDFQDEKPVLLVFWATWCGYCAKELEDLKAFTDKYQDVIQIIAVSSGESKETIKDYIQEENVNFLMVLDEDRKIWNQYFVRGTPSHFLIDKQGKIAALRPGLASRENLENLLTMFKTT